MRGPHIPFSYVLDAMLGNTILDPIDPLVLNSPNRTPGTVEAVTINIGPFMNIVRDTKRRLSVMDIGYFSYFLFLYLLDKETQRDTYLKPCSEFILNFLDIIYSQMTPIHKQSFLLKLEPLLEPLPFRLCLIQ